eukprot:TRINITY_DN10870_c0_g5_i1.p2 TRINITY_DN10870_c0_g5~~TRINITY_DN10870_c0_g5_i1.p2  ORF type:complete len:208 (-),score=66.64 TRINITY_DN10870_c0_g5_i1:94-717(-)
MGKRSGKEGGNKCKEQIKKLLHMLSGTKVGSASGKIPSKKKVRKGSSSSEYTPCSKSRVAKIRPAKPHKNHYETLVNSLSKKVTKKNIECNFKKYGNEDPYKIMAESSKTRNGMAPSLRTENTEKPKLAGKSFTKEDEKHTWKKYIESSGELCSMTTNKSSAQIGRVVSAEAKEDLSSDEALTIIENDCENNYDLICNTLEAKYSQS